jgi:DNA-binding FadR family transcriptional regulator
VTPEERERHEILERVQTYVREVGIAGIGIERVARWLEIPESRLREYFETDSDLVMELVALNRVRLREGFTRLAADRALSDGEVRRKMWNVYVAAADDSRLFFEAYALALHDDYYGPFLHGIKDWLDLIVESVVARGIPHERAAAYAKLSLAVYRGAMLDYVLTGDRARVEAAMELWFATAERIMGSLS